MEADCDTALEQITDRMYMKELEEDYDQIFGYGIAFFKKRCLLKKIEQNKKDAGNCQLYNSYLHLSFHSIIYKKLPIASHFYIHVTSAAEKASALSYPLSHTRMDK